MFLDVDVPAAVRRTPAGSRSRRIRTYWHPLSAAAAWRCKTGVNEGFGGALDMGVVVLGWRR